MASRTYSLRLMQSGSIITGLTNDGTLKIDEAAGVAYLDLGTETLAHLMASAKVAPADVASGLLKKAVASGGAAGDITVAAIVATSEIVAVIYFPISAGNVTSVSDLTSEFTSAAGKINNTGGTATTGGKLLVIWR